ncbi:MAG: regulatory protein RecX [Eubacteriales bacterium]|nr:regulatory protein RecX [Eubacteriales bacterium]
MVVSDLKQTSPERYRICFEDGSEIRSTLSAIAEMRVAKGKDFDDEQIEKLKSISFRSLTLEKAIELVSYRQMSAKELFDKLRHKGIDEETAEYCAVKLVEMGIIDEERYASSLAAHYSGKGYGAGKIRAEFSRRGIPRDLWDDALNDLPQSDDKLDHLIRSKLSDPSDRNQIRKVSASLYRRGYSWNEIRSALERCSMDMDVTEPEEF